MSVVIVGGNECMTRQYEKVCSSHGYKAKIFAKENGSFRKKLSWPLRSSITKGHKYSRPVDTDSIVDIVRFAGMWLIKTGPLKVRTWGLVFALPFVTFSHSQVYY